VLSQEGKCAFLRDSRFLVSIALLRSAGPSGKRLSFILWQQTNNKDQAVLTLLLHVRSAYM